MIINKAQIKSGNDNRRAPGCGAVMSWSELTGLKEGTTVSVISKCEDTKVAVILIQHESRSACGKKVHKAGTRKLVPLAALSNEDVSNLLESYSPWKNTKEKGSFLHAV